MRLFLAGCLALGALACSKPDQQAAAGDTATAALSAGAVTPISLADVAGTWNVRTTNEAGDTTLVEFQMVATPDQAGWTYTFPGRKPMPVRVIAVDADSIVTEAGPYESVLRKGVQVTTRSVTRRQGDRLVGNTVAHYSTGTDTMLHLKFEGTRAP